MASYSALSVDRVPLVGEDPLYQLKRAFQQDKDQRKIDLGIGAYRDDNGKPWILPVVRQAEDITRGRPNRNHEYLSIEGLPGFITGAQNVLFGEGSHAITENRICSFQTISGTGAVHLGATFLSRFYPSHPTVLISDPTWPNHAQIFGQLNFTVKQYPYFTQGLMSVDIDGMLSCLRMAPPRSIIVLQACAHNPTGMDPSSEDWEEIAKVMKEKQHFPFFDCAYQGFASGDLLRDSQAIRYFVSQGFECCVAQSFAKNMGLYGERVGAFHFVCSPSERCQQLCEHINGQLAIIQRAEISNPPAYGAQIASTILNDPSLFCNWEQDLLLMSNRLSNLRIQVREQLESRGTPGTWTILSQQKGMFSFLPLSKETIRLLREEWHIYMTDNGRISVAGLNYDNIQYFIDAVDAAVSVTIPAAHKRSSSFSLSAGCSSST